jgi:phenylacetate-CoA ligase
VNIMDASPRRAREFIGRWPIYARDRDNPNRLPAGELEKLRDALLQRQLAFLEACSPYYRRRFREEGVDIDCIRGVRDLPRLPVTFRQDYLDDPLSFLPSPAERRSELMTYEITYTSGRQGGDPVPFFNTAYDMMALSLQMRRTAEICWLTPRDTVFNLFPYSGLPHIGFYRTVHMASSIGARLVNALLGEDLPGFPVHHSLDEAAQLAADSEASVLAGTGSGVRHLVLRAQQLGIRLPRTRVALAMGEAVPERMREDIRRRLQESGAGEVFVANGYGFTECQGAFVECCEFGGCHNPSPDLYYPEILDRDSLEPLEEGELGLLAVTHLNRRGTSVLRYVIGDLAALEREACPHCGRTGERLVVKVGSTYATRAADAISVKSRLVNPQVLRNLMDSMGGVLRYRLQLEKERPGEPYSADRVRVVIAVPEESRGSAAEEVRERIKQAAGIEAEVVMADDADLYDPSLTLKDTRIVDRRR